MEVAIIEKEALLLPDTDRALLAEKLIESISRTSTELQNDWIREADDRMEAFREGKISAVDGSSAMSELRSQFSK